MRWSQQCAVFEETLPSRPFNFVLEKWSHAVGLETNKFCVRSELAD